LEVHPRRAESASTESDHIAPPIAALLASIRAGVGKGASPDTRTAGATACRSILTLLEAKSGQPLAAEPQRPALPATPIAALLKQPGLLNQLAAMSREQLLYGTHAALFGVNPWRLQGWMGHKRIEETMLYVHVADVHARALAAPLD